MSDEKTRTRLLEDALSDTRKPRPMYSRIIEIANWLCVVVCLYALLIVFSPTAFRSQPRTALKGLPESDSQDLCPQETPLTPVANHEINSALENVYSTGEFKTRATNWLAGAVRVPCALLFIS